MVRLIIAIILYVCFLNNASCRPTDEPFKFSLQSFTETSENPGVILSTLQQGQDLLRRITDTIRLGKGRLVNSFILAKNFVAARVEDAVSESQNTIASLLAGNNDITTKARNVLSSVDENPLDTVFPPKTRETARLEKESGQAFFEKQNQNPVETLLQSVLNPTPIVDNIQEHEKYGNSGDQFMYIGRALVNGFEGISNFLNGVVDLPVTAAKKTSRGITEALNHLGSRLIGLE